jgi:hypothetical protein
LEAAVLAVCHKTADPNYQPEAQVRSMADEAKQMAGPNGDFLSAFNVQLLTVRGKEAVSADADFIAKAGSRCRRDRSEIDGLLGKAISPDNTAFTAAQAGQLSALLSGVSHDLSTVAGNSSAKNARAYATGFSSQARQVTNVAVQLGKANDGYPDTVVKAAELRGRLETDLMNVSLDVGGAGVTACGDLFSPSP